MSMLSIWVSIRVWGVTDKHRNVSIVSTQRSRGIQNEKEVANQSAVE